MQFKSGKVELCPKHFYLERLKLRLIVRQKKNCRFRFYLILLEIFPHESLIVLKLRFFKYYFLFFLCVDPRSAASYLFKIVLCGTVGPLLNFSCPVCHVRLPASPPFPLPPPAGFAAAALLAVVHLLRGRKST